MRFKQDQGPAATAFYLRECAVVRYISAGHVLEASPCQGAFTVLAAFGLLSDHNIDARSLGIDVNLVGGSVPLIFGAAMLLPGRAASRASSPAHASKKARSRAAERGLD